MCVSDLIGLSYRYGADGSNGEIDCINLVLRTLDELKIPRPPIKPEWYQAHWRTIGRELLAWGKRTQAATVDGDVVLLSTAKHVFGVAWQQGILHIEDTSKRSVWRPIAILKPVYILRHCSRMNAI